eukprot:8815553-Pyramimonas_sp.AAC.1
MATFPSQEAGATGGSTSPPCKTARLAEDPLEAVANLRAVVDSTRGEMLGCLLYTSDAADDTPCVDL